MIRVTRRYRFSASHRLHSSELSEEENYRLYGKCNQPFGHGHNYLVDVSVRGPIEARSGQAVDIPVLDRLVQNQVLRAFDHKNLNAEIPEFQKVVPTSENIGLELYKRLEESWHAAFPGPWPVLEKLRIAETPRNIFEIERHERQ